MIKKSLFGVTYVSLWIIIWGSIASVIDRPLLDNGTYIEGSIGQFGTFSLSGAMISIVAILLFPRILKNNFVIAALGLDTE